MTRAEEELQDAEDDIAEYESYVNDGSYKSYFKVDEYQAIYDENLKALTDKMDEWGISWSQVTGGGGSVQIGGGAGANMQSGRNFQRQHFSFLQYSGTKSERFGGSRG